MLEQLDHGLVAPTADDVFNEASRRVGLKLSLPQWLTNIIDQWAGC